MRFLHAADIHLDAQLQLPSRDGAPPAALAAATRDALGNLVTLALAEQVDFLLIAGDLFDSESSDVASWRFAARQFQRLQPAGIPVFLIRGNHDFLAVNSTRLQWPENVHEFRSSEPHTETIDELSVAIHGQSFPSRAVSTDLTPRYPEPVPGAFNIGLLHTSLSGSALHDTYAPTDPAILKLKGYDYWALGHVHTHQRMAEEPAIIYPGCTQGRHANETGAKGCVIVTVEDAAVTDIVFHAVDAVRWQRLTIELAAEDDRDELADRVRRGLVDLAAASEGRPIAVRLVLKGRCSAHHWLVSEAGAQTLPHELEVLARDIGEVWIEQVVVRTGPPIDVESLRAGQDLLGEMLRDLQMLRSESGKEAAALADKALQPLWDKAGRELTKAQLDAADPAVVRGWLEQVEGLVVDALAGTEDAA